MYPVSQQFSHTVDGFVRDLSVLIRSAALEMAHEALQNANSRSNRPKTRAIGHSFVPSVAKGQRRSSADLESVTNAILDYVARHPGQRIEQIARGLDVSSKDLVLPVKKLISQRRLSKQG